MTLEEGEGKIGIVKVSFPGKVLKAENRAWAGVVKRKRKRGQKGGGSIKNVKKFVTPATFDPIVCGPVKRVLRAKVRRGAPNVHPEKSGTVSRKWEKK